MLLSLPHTLHTFSPGTAGQSHQEIALVSGKENASHVCLEKSWQHLSGSSALQDWEGWKTAGIKQLLSREAALVARRGIESLVGILALGSSHEQTPVRARTAFSDIFSSWESVIKGMSWAHT